MRFSKKLFVDFYKDKIEQQNGGHLSHHSSCVNYASGHQRMEFKEFQPRFESSKTRFKLSAGLNLETFDIILSGTNHI